MKHDLVTVPDASALAARAAEFVAARARTAVTDHSRFTFAVSGGLSTGPVHVWTTNLGSSQPADYFVHAGDVTPDEARCEKPDPKFFAFARGRLSALGYVLEDILHVAQSQYHDIGVARELGYKVCWIERRKGMGGFGGTQVPAKVTEPDYHFSTLGELANAVDAEAR